MQRGQKGVNFLNIKMIFHYDQNFYIKELDGERISASKFEVYQWNEQHWVHILRQKILSVTLSIIVFIGVEYVIESYY